MSQVVVLTTLLLLAIIGSCSAALPLPSYIKPCATSDPNFNKCAAESAKNAFPHFLNGDRKYKIPNLNPLSIEQLKIENGPKQSGLTFILKNVKVYGIRDVSIVETNFDFDKKHVAHTLKMPTTKIESDYNVDGRILLLPIKGEGVANLTLSDVTVKFEHDYDIVKREDGEEYMDLKNAKSDVKVSNMKIHLTNLFNGNKLLTSYLTPCSKNDPALNQCAIKHGREGIPAIIQGDKEYNIPSMDPLRIPQIRVKGGAERAGGSVAFRDVDIYGLKNTTVRDVNIDLKKHHIDWYLKVPRIVMLSQYTVKGRVLILPIVGSGDSNITLMDVVLKYSFDYDVEKKADGKEYMNPIHSDLAFDTSRAYIKLNNLFNGDRFLGASMNRFLDENWREMVKEVGPHIADVIGEAIRQIINSITTLVSYDNIFLDE